MRNTRGLYPEFSRITKWLVGEADSRLVGSFGFFSVLAAVILHCKKFNVGPSKPRTSDRNPSARKETMSVRMPLEQKNQKADNVLLQLGLKDFVDKR